MSHFTVMVVGPDPEKQLAPFDEQLEVPRYILYTKAELIAEKRKEIEDYKNGLYAEFLADPVAYRKGRKHSAHLHYIEWEFPEKLKWTDEQVYADAIEGEEDVDADGNVYSTLNPQRKWDWYQLGGRWSGKIKLKEGRSGVTGEKSLVMQNTPGIDQALKGDIANFNELMPFAILKNGAWFERGRMLFWGTVENEKDDAVWRREVETILADIPDDTLISMFDCHI